MKKLEIKHLAPYLPYGIECLTTTGVRGKMIQLSHSEVYLDCDLKWDSGALYNWMLSVDIKPILRPMSDIEKKLTIANGKTIIPLTHYKGLTHNIQHCIWMGGSLNFTTYAEYTSVISLIEWHFDVFGLIENGLAVDINTITNN